MKNLITSMLLLLSISLQAQTITVDGSTLLVSQNNSFPLWLASGSSVSPNPPVSLLSVVEYTEITMGTEVNLGYSRVLNITESTVVPEGKVWKVVSALELYELGCIDETAFNYNAAANIADESCFAVIEGCTDASAFNYELPTGDVSVDVNTDNGTCIAVVLGCMDAIACNYNSLVNTDNSTCEFAAEGYDCDGNETTLNYEIGDLVEGGIVFYIDETGEHGLVAATEDLASTYVWGCYGTTISGADGQSIGTGLQNTLDIVSGCSETPIAASLALAYQSEGYSDWYLPSVGELTEMYNTIGNGGSGGNIGGFSNSYYWSSSEYNYNSAWRVDFSNGTTNGFSKDLARVVRIIRAF
jgi:hypothetical protein